MQWRSYRFPIFKVNLNEEHICDICPCTANGGKFFLNYIILSYKHSYHRSLNIVLATTMQTSTTHKAQIPFIALS